MKIPRFNHIMASIGCGTWKPSSPNDNIYIDWQSWGLAISFIWWAGYRGFILQFGPVVVHIGRWPYAKR